MNWAGKIGELLRASIVLALFFLNFAHVPVSAAPADVYVPLTLASICGDPLGDDRGQAHAPCHACRIGSGADLPPTCAIEGPASTFAAVIYDAVAVVAHATAYSSGHSARGPPAF